MEVITETHSRTYGARLEDARLAQLWSQRELAERAGIHINTVYRVEAEVTKPSQIVQQKIANALGLDRRDLFFA